jgi:hypothetical protein
MGWLEVLVIIGANGLVILVCEILKKIWKNW